MKLGTVALSNLKNRPMRSFLTMAGVVVAVAAFVAFVGLSRGIGVSIRSSVDSRGGDIVITEGAAPDFMSSVVPVSLVETVRKAPLVADAAAELARVTELEDGTSVIAVAWAADAFGWKGLTLVEGRLPQGPDRAELVVGKGLAARLGLKPGDSLALFYSPFTVVGVVDSTNIINRNLVVGLLPRFQALTYREGQATSIVAQLVNRGNSAEREEALNRLAALLPSYDVQATDGFVQRSLYIRVANVLAWSISLVAVLGAVLGILNTMAMAVNERRRDIAVMAAVGWPPRRIIASILIEGCVLSIGGGLLGCATGTAVAWSVAATPQVAGFMTPSIDLWLLAEGVMISLVMGLAGALLPAWRGTRVDPAAILRGH